ncbi:hypothetical protein [Laceyella putida]|uniref:Uncharacterized protein n=1 Tax=Laceyella putida TaxID=110101 RepID=A0ABW2RH00_9BACL
MRSIVLKIVSLSNPIKGLPGNADFHPTIETVGFQSAKICKITNAGPDQKASHAQQSD